MNKFFVLLLSMFLLNGCIESFVAIGASSSNGKMAQSAIKTGVSYSIKAQTGKSPMEHALNYGNTRNSKNSSDPCVALLNNKSSDMCVLLKDQTKNIKTKIKKRSKIKYLN